MIPIFAASVNAMGRRSSWRDKPRTTITGDDGASIPVFRVYEKGRSERGWLNEPLSVSAQQLERNLATPRPIVEVTDDNLLPGAQNRLPIHNGH